jgi:hypothetical protein
VSRHAQNRENARPTIFRKDEDYHDDGNAPVSSRPAKALTWRAFLNRVSSGVAAGAFAATSLTASRPARGAPADRSDLRVTRIIAQDPRQSDGPARGRPVRATSPPPRRSSVDVNDGYEKGRTAAKRFIEETSDANPKKVSGTVV